MGNIFLVSHILLLFLQNMRNSENIGHIVLVMDIFCMNLVKKQLQLVTPKEYYLYKYMRNFERFLKLNYLMKKTPIVH